MLAEGGDLSALSTYFVIQSEPKILRLVIIIIIDRRFVRQTEAPIKNHEIFPGAPHKDEHQVFHDISIQDSIS